MSSTDRETADILPDLLYKYRCWSANAAHSFHKRLLTHNEIYFSNPSSFNDPFDCQIALRLDKASAGKMRRSLMKQLQQSQPEMPREQRVAIVRNRVLELRNPKSRKEEKDKRRKSVDEGYGIFSLSANPENLVKWAHYADAHKGICVGLSTQALQDFSDYLYARWSIPGDLLQVKYVNDYPVMDAFADTYEVGDWSNVVVRTKSTHWKHEEEYRLIIGTEENTERSYSLRKDAIRVVILGAMMPEESKQEIRSILEPKEPQVAIVQAELKEYSFGLDIRVP